MRRWLPLVVVTVVVFGAPQALACGGLVAPNGSVQLGRTTTLAAYHDGLEHYVTAFTYFGEGGEFGSIVPLPAVPSKVERGGDWTLQRLVRETTPVTRTNAVAGGSGALASADAQVVYETKIDALDITILKGGGEEVGRWAQSHGFLLPPDAPEVLEYYASRSQIFMAAVFDGQRAAERGQRTGDGTPIHLTIPTSNPWVPLRILSLGRQAQEIVEADVYLLTDRRPALLPVRAEGWTLERRVLASEQLLADLRSDKGMEWMPSSGMWLTHFVLSADAPQVRFDLAVDATGRGRPSWEWAGLERRATPQPTVAPTAVPTATPVVVTPVPATPRLDAAAPVRSTSGRSGLLPVAALLTALVALTGALAWRRR